MQMCNNDECDFFTGDPGSKNKVGQGVQFLALTLTCDSTSAVFTVSFSSH